MRSAAALVLVVLAPGRSSIGSADSVAIVYNWIVRPHTLTLLALLAESCTVKANLRATAGQLQGAHLPSSGGDDVPKTRALCQEVISTSSSLKLSE